MADCNSGVDCFHARHRAAQVTFAGEIDDLTHQPVRDPHPDQNAYIQSQECIRTLLGGTVTLIGVYLLGIQYILVALSEALSMSRIVRYLVPPNAVPVMDIITAGALLLAGIASIA